MDPNYRIIPRRDCIWNLSVTLLNATPTIINTMIVAAKWMMMTTVSHSVGTYLKLLLIFEMRCCRGGSQFFLITSMSCVCFFSTDCFLSRSFSSRPISAFRLWYSATTWWQTDVLNNSGATCWVKQTLVRIDGARVSAVRRCGLPQ